MGDARGDLSARERLDDRQRALTARELPQDDALQRLIVFRQDEVTEPLAHFPLDRRELPPHVVHVGATHGQLGLELRIVGPEAELHASVGHQLFDASQQRVDVRLAEPIRVEALQEDRRLQAALRQEPRDDLLLEHATELARHPGGEEEAGPADVEREAARGADRVVDDLCGDGQHGLLPVVGRHHAAAPAEELFHPRQPRVIEDELDAGGLGRDFLGQIVDRGTQATVDDDRVGALPCQLERPQEALPIVTDRRLPPDREPDVLELLTHVAEVGVDDPPGQDLVTRADDLDAHPGRT